MYVHKATVFLIMLVTLCDDVSLNEVTYRNPRRSYNMDLDHFSRCQTHHISQPCTYIAPERFHPSTHNDRDEQFYTHFLNKTYKTQDHFNEYMLQSLHTNATPLLNVLIIMILSHVMGCYKPSSFHIFPKFYVLSIVLLETSNMDRSKITNLFKFLQCNISLLTNLIVLYLHCYE